MANTTRTTQLAVEVITEGPGTVRLTQVAVEVITDPNFVAAATKRRTVMVIMT